MSVELAWTILHAFNWIVLGYFILLNSVYLVTSIFAFRALRLYARRLKALEIDDLVAGAGAPPISLIAPAHNEEATCVESVKSLLALNYPDFEILVVNDGSSDRTLERLAEAFDHVPSPRSPTAEIPTKNVREIYRSRRSPDLWVIDKENGGKADALNVGVNHCHSPFFCAIDADSLLERDALSRIIRPFLEDGTTVASGGIIRIVNGCTVNSGMVTDIRLPRSLLASFQVLEYLRAFLAGRMGWDAMNSTLIISGAFGLFRRTTVVDVGGYATDTVGEDMELVVRMQRHCLEKGIPARIGFVPDPVAWTECPETMKVLGRQRDRWQRGLIETLSRHRVMLFNRRYGTIGTTAFPYFYCLEMMGPIIELCGYIVFIASWFAGILTPLFVTAFLLVALVLGIALSIAAVGLEELSFRRYPRQSDLLKLFALAIVENFGFRQLCTYWRVRGVYSALRGRKGWGKMDRKGFGDGARG